MKHIYICLYHYRLSELLTPLSPLNQERPYLRTLIAQIEMETRERNALDSLKLQKKDAKKQTH